VAVEVDEARADPAPAAVDDRELRGDLDLARVADLLDLPVADDHDRSVDDLAALLPDDEGLRAPQHEGLPLPARLARERRDGEPEEVPANSAPAQRTSSPATQTRWTRVERSSGLPSSSATSASRPG